nr:MAG TPA: hypothetical protein [Caudoviricetes sp.]
MPLSLLFITLPNLPYLLAFLCFLLINNYC